VTEGSPTSAGSAAAVTLHSDRTFVGVVGSVAAVEMAYHSVASAAVVGRTAVAAGDSGQRMLGSAAVVPDWDYTCWKRCLSSSYAQDVAVVANVKREGEWKLEVKIGCMA